MPHPLEKGDCSQEVRDTAVAGPGPSLFPRSWPTAHPGSAPENWEGGAGPGLTVPPPPQKRYRAVYDYSAADEDEVSFQDGDTIVNVQQIDDGWMYGTVERTGDTGMLPANYVEAI